MVSKLKFLGETNANFTQDAIYDVQSETLELYYVKDDTDTLAEVSKNNANFIPHWAISSLKELVENEAFTKDTYGTVFTVVSADDTRLRVDSSERDCLEMAQVSYISEYGSVERAVSVLTTSYRFSIVYTQDPLKEFATLQALGDYTSDLGWKLCYLANDSIVITDENGKVVIPEYVGIKITF